MLAILHKVNHILIWSELQDGKYEEKTTNLRVVTQNESYSNLVWAVTTLKFFVFWLISSFYFLGEGSVEFHNLESAEKALEAYQRKAVITNKVSLRAFFF